MSRSASPHRCQQCSATALRWQGRCPACGAWNSLRPASPAAVGSNASVASAQPIGSVPACEGVPVPTGIAEVDTVLGGGLVPGSVTLVGGEPGIGKSTLVLQLSAALARAGLRVLYVAGEESASQVRRRADRLDSLAENLWLLAATDVTTMTASIDEILPEVVVVDSIQAVADPDLGGLPGSVRQVAAVAGQLVTLAKGRGVSVLLVGHVTKDGNLAGPRTLEHLVDSVIAFEGDRHHALRFLRVLKHRFGPTDQLGVFEMTGPGLVGVVDPSALFLADRRPGTPGSAVVPVLEGHRPLVVEVQALTTPAAGGGSRRCGAQGIDSGRMALLLAVLGRRAGVHMADHDVYAMAVGGVRIREPGADLALCLALASARLDRAPPVGWVACGEVGLGGEVRRVARLEHRLTEAARLGFETALVPLDAPVVPGLTLVEVASVAQALEASGLVPAEAQVSGSH